MPSAFAFAFAFAICFLRKACWTQVSVKYYKAQKSLSLYPSQWYPSSKRNIWILGTFEQNKFCACKEYAYSQPNNWEC